MIGIGWVKGEPASGAPAGTPNGTTSRALVLADMAHVVWAVNLACLGFHVWPHLHDHPDVADELRIDLVNAIESLSPSHREVLLLRDLEDLTIWEIAGRLGVTREAAKSRLRRARTLVREYLLGTKDSGRVST